MFRRRFFSRGGLAHFTQNMARNVRNVSRNSATLCLRTWSSAMGGAAEHRLNQELRLGIENLYDNPTEFNRRFCPPCRFSIHTAMLGDGFFTYFIIRLPMMLHGLKYSWGRRRSPSRPEITDVCEHCISTYAQHAYETPPERLTAQWHEGFKQGFRWTRWWIPRPVQDGFYYDLAFVERFFRSYVEPAAQVRDVESSGSQFPAMPDEQAACVEGKETYWAWLTANASVFIDKLAEHLQIAYPIFSDTWWDTVPLDSSNEA